MEALPEGLTAYKRTPSFTAASVPAALTRAHDTRDGVWALIHVEQGQLCYERLEGEGGDEVSASWVLEPGRLGVILPKQLHRVRPLSDDVRFYVEFWRAL